MLAVMYLIYPPVDIHAVYILYGSLLCKISLVILYKTLTSNSFITLPFLSTYYNHISPASVSKTLAA